MSQSIDTREKAKTRARYNRIAPVYFCSVPDPERGLRELARVVKPDGRIALLEHVRIDRPPLAGKLMDWLDPLVVRMMGAHINRHAAEVARESGLEIEGVEDLGPLGVVKLITARPARSNGRDNHKVGGDDG